MYYTNSNGRQLRACVSDEERQLALKLAHDEDVAGHWQAQKTWKRLKAAAFWPGRAEDCFRYSLTCHACQLRSSVDMKAPERLILKRSRKRFLILKSRFAL